MCATIEHLLSLDKEGWMEIAKMSDEELGVYLKDITDLERSSRVINVNNSFDDTKDSSSSEDETEKDDNPFTKSLKKNKKAKKTRKLLSTYDMDAEAKLLEQELENL